MNVEDKIKSIFGEFSLEERDELVDYFHFEWFKNPNKLPINEVFIERERIEPDPIPSDWHQISFKDRKKRLTVSTFKEVIPALDKSWFPLDLPIFEYQNYDFNGTEEDNAWFLENNKGYNLFLQYLIQCNYHQFWCSIIFNDEVCKVLREFTLSPIPIYLYPELKTKFQDMYKTTFNRYYMVWKRLFNFKESEAEYMSTKLGIKYLIERELFDLPVAVILVMLYGDFDNDFIDNLSSIYHNSADKKFIQKEMEDMFLHMKMILEQLIQLVQGTSRTGIFEAGLPSLDERPKLFSLPWVNSVINYLINTLLTLLALFNLHKPSVEFAVVLQIPEIVMASYEPILKEIYELLDGRSEVENDEANNSIIRHKLALVREKYVEVFHCFSTYYLDQTISNLSNPTLQEKSVETFLEIISSSLEYEIFICDYNYKYDLKQTMENFEDFSQIDKTRVEYIINSLNSIERMDFIKQRKSKMENAFAEHVPKLENLQINEEPQPGTSNQGASQEEILLENNISFIMGMFPHLGDGFIEQCLMHYNNSTEEVVQAILEQNLPPHLSNVPFDMPRIPPEPEPAKPILAYQGKKPGYQDALQMLDDKEEKKKLKTYIIEGLQFSDRFNYLEEGEEDDTLDGEDYVVDTRTTEIADKINSNKEELVSDTSYSDDEEEPGPQTNTFGFKPFCEDPAKIRERYEAQRGRGRGRGRNVVGKAKGQGQEKDVLKNRQDKNVNKSKRANHNRKSGSQWKRNKGMLPS